MPTAGGKLPPADVALCARPDGVRHGAFVKWLDGRLWAVGHYHEGELDGSFATWHENGRKWMLVDFENGELVGGTHWNVQGIKVSEETPGTNGEKGTVRHWYESGAPKFEAEQTGGQFDGDFRSWYESGQIRSVGRYAHDERVGEWACWSESGALKLEVTHRPDGTLETDDPDLEIEPWMQYCVNGCPGQRLGDRRCSTEAAAGAEDLPQGYSR